MTIKLPVRNCYNKCLELLLLHYYYYYSCYCYCYSCIIIVILSNPLTNIIITIIGTHWLTGCGTQSAALTETWGGVLLLLVSLSLVIACLVLLVKTLNSLMQGHIATIIHHIINATLPGKAACLTGYLRILAGGVITFFIQSSSLFTCSLTPLVGLGIVTVESMYPLTLGANLGTTFTSILAALTAEPHAIAKAMQISLCHLFFNISGILLYYPIPVLRRVPIRLAKWMGHTTAQYRWFALAYLIIVFFFIPAVVFGLSIAGWYIFMAVFAPIFILLLLVGIINVIQKKCPGRLPRNLKTWEWLPKPLRSLQPYDDIINRCIFKQRCCQKILSCCKDQGGDTAVRESEVVYIVPDELVCEDGRRGMSAVELVNILEVSQPENTSVTDL